MCEFAVTGQGFLSLPRNLAGVIAYGSNPMQWYSNSAETYWVYEVERSDSRLVLRGLAAHSYTSASWLGLLSVGKQGEIVHLFSYPG